MPSFDVPPEAAVGPLGSSLGGSHHGDAINPSRPEIGDVGRESNAVKANDGKGHDGGDGVAWVSLGDNPRGGGTSTDAAAAAAEQMVQQVLAARMAVVRMKQERASKGGAAGGPAGSGSGSGSGSGCQSGLMLALPPSAALVASTTPSQGSKAVEVTKSHPAADASTAGLSAMPPVPPAAVVQPKGSISDMRPPWADDIEDDDEVVFCSPQEGEGNGVAFAVLEEANGPESESDEADDAAIRLAPTGAEGQQKFVPEAVGRETGQGGGGCAKIVASGGASNCGPCGLMGPGLSGVDGPTCVEGTEPSAFRRDLFR